MVNSKVTAVRDTYKVAGVERASSPYIRSALNRRDRAAMHSGRCVAVAVGLVLFPAAGKTQRTSSYTQGSLIIDPQHCATAGVMKPLASTAVEQLVAAPTLLRSGPRPTVSAGHCTIRSDHSTTPNDDFHTASRLQHSFGGLPRPGNDPMHIDPATDPILELAQAQMPWEQFRKAVGDAIVYNPAHDEAQAQSDEAAGALAEARARALPVADLSISMFQVIDRAFSTNLNNILERSRPSHRTDGLLRIQQPIVDFGSNLSHIRASQARLGAAQAGVEDTSTKIALRVVSSWYTIYGYRVLVRLGETFAESQRDLRTSIENRVMQGTSAPGDIAQVDSYIASTDAQIAEFRRQLASAEAEYTAVTGSRAPTNLSRAPVPDLGGIASAMLTNDTEALPAVRAAKLGVDAARSDLRATKSDRLPQLSAGIDAGRYGIIETTRDYDVRGSLTLSMRFGGGAGARVSQVQARAKSADARLRRTRIEAQRDAEIALSDVKALEQAQTAIGNSYLASRRSRDVLAERFRVSRGTVFDLLGGENNYFGVAVRYLQTVIELDTARYALLARTGRLLPVFGISPKMAEH